MSKLFRKSANQLVKSSKKEKETKNKRDAFLLQCLRILASFKLLKVPVKWKIHSKINPWLIVLSLPVKRFQMSDDSSDATQGCLQKFIQSDVTLVESLATPVI